jgi:hypothetical protein
VDQTRKRARHTAHKVYWRDPAREGSDSDVLGQADAKRYAGGRTPEGPGEYVDAAGVHTLAEVSEHMLATASHLGP